MRKSLAALLLLCLPLPAFAQGNSAHPTGRFTPGHTVRANTASGSPYSDGGGAAGSDTFGEDYLTEIGITAPGLPLCINDALTSATSGYHRLCMGHDADGNALLAVDSIGTAAKDFFVSINGVEYPFFGPGTGTGNVLGPVSSLGNDLAVFTDTSGKLIRGTDGAIFVTPSRFTAGNSPNLREFDFNLRRTTTAEDRSNAAAPATLFTLHDYKPPAGGTYPGNPLGMYADLWIDTAATLNGFTAAFRGNSYTIPQITTTIGTAGTGYTNGDIVTLSGGTCNTDLNTAPQFQLTVVGSVVTAATYLPAGACNPYPANPAAVTGGTGTGLTLNLTQGSVNVTWLGGVYGRPRHTALGTVTGAYSLYADGCYNSGGGTITNCYGLILAAPNDANQTNAYGIFQTNVFKSGTIASGTGVDITLNPGTGGFVTSNTDFVAGAGSACRGFMAGGVTTAFGAFGTTCDVAIQGQGTGTVYFQNNNVTGQQVVPLSGGRTSTMNLLTTNTAGTALHEVKVGAPDSGGTGFRALTIAN